MAVTIDENGDTITIQVAGRFDFSIHREFLDAYTGVPKGERCFVVDLAHTEYIDSSAMGMLLQLRGHASANSVVELKNSSEGVREILHIANFDKLFAVA